MANHMRAASVSTQLGTNGRSCLTCHQPSQAMSVGKGYIRTLYVTSKGRDPRAPA
jgi:hypothetical protein